MNIKYLSTLCLAIAIMASCKKSSPSFEEMVGPYATITGIKSQTKATENDPITDSTVFVSKYAHTQNATDTAIIGYGAERMFGEDQRDTINGKLFFLSVDVIGSTPSWEGDIDELGGMVNGPYKDFVISGLMTKDGRRLHPNGFGADYFQYKDTIAYIPNKVVREACKKIKAAFQADNYIECKRLFDEAFVFIPTTGAKWRALKAAGIE